MPNKKFLIILAALLVVFFASLFFFKGYFIGSFGPKGGPEPEGGAEIDEEQTQDLYPKEKLSMEDLDQDTFKKELAYFTKASQEKDPEPCQYMMGKKACLGTVAALSGDVSICSELDDPTDRDNCILDASLWSAEAEDCRAVKDGMMQNLCLSRVFSRQPQEKICQELASDKVPFTQSHCYFDLAQEEEKGEYCKQAGDFRGRCYYSVAVQTHDKELATKIEDQELLDYFYYIYSLEDSAVRPCRLIEDEAMGLICEAGASLEVDYCGDIKDRIDRDYCYNTVAHRTGDPEDCQDNHSCMIDLATKANDVSLCETLEEDSYDDYKVCLRSVFYYNKTGERCTRLSGQDRSKCFYFLATMTGDESYCQELPDPDFYSSTEVTQERCLSKVARVKPDRSLCQQLSGESDRDYCHQISTREMVEANQDPEWCQQVGNEFHRSLCAYNTSINTNTYKLCDDILEHDPDSSFTKEKHRKCYSNYFDHKRREVLQSAFSSNGSEDDGGENPHLEIQVRSGEGITHLAEKALNNYLNSLSDGDKGFLDLPLVLGQRIYIEDYLKNKYSPGSRLEAGDIVRFEQADIREAIQESQSLTDMQLENLSEYTYGRKKYSFSELNEPALSFCDYKMNTEGKEYEKYLCKAWLKGEYNVCESDGLKDNRTSECYRWLAEKVDNPGVCWTFSQQENKEKCIIVFAHKYKDQEMCEMIEGDYSRRRDMCYMNVAKELEDVSLCEKVSDPGSRDGCRGRIDPSGEEAADCGNFTGRNSKNRCFKEAARKQNDPSLCEKIVSPDKKAGVLLRDQCYDALSKNNPTVCSLIDDSLVRYGCYDNRMDDFVYSYDKHCESATSTLSRDLCKINNTPEIYENCSSISTSDIRDLCRYYGAKKGILGCEQVDQETYQRKCVYYTALDNRNAENCLEIKDDYERNRCINNFVNLVQDRSGCELMDEDHYMKDDCGDTYLGPQKEKQQLLEE